MAFKKILLGTAMMSSVRVFRLLGQFVAIPILARLLTPADYGLVATWETALPELEGALEKR